MGSPTVPKRRAAVRCTQAPTNTTHMAETDTATATDTSSDPNYQIVVDQPTPKLVSLAICPTGLMGLAERAAAALSRLRAARASPAAGTETALP